MKQSEQVGISLDSLLYDDQGEIFPLSLDHKAPGSFCNLGSNLP